MSRKSSKMKILLPLLIVALGILLTTIVVTGQPRNPPTEEKEAYRRAQEKRQSITSVDLPPTEKQWLQTLVKTIATLPETMDANQFKALVKMALNGHLEAIFEVTKLSSDKETAAKLHLYLSNTIEHVPSQVQLGMYYYQQEDLEHALHYFKLAGENGPHQASLYNAGRIYAELGNWPLALSWIYACCAPSMTPTKLTQTCRDAFDLVSEQISLKDQLAIEQIEQIFLKANRTDDSFTEENPKVKNLWLDAMYSLKQFNQTFVSSRGQIQDDIQMEAVVRNLRKLWEQHDGSSNLSDLQAYLLLDTMNDMLGPLAGMNDKFLPQAAVYAEALARSPLCYKHAAAEESQPACFNGAAASAMSYYRRLAQTQKESPEKLASTQESMQRVFALAAEHPEAATQWKRHEQTPRVYHADLKAQPWWNTSQFDIVMGMEGLYLQQQAVIKQELEAVKQLQEGLLLLDQQDVSHVEISASGNILKSDSTSGVTTVGLQRIFTPYIGVRTSDEVTQTSGAGGWSSYGPLFDGAVWHQDKCRLIPTICEVVEKHQSSLCTSNQIGDASDGDIQKDIARRCGADIVVTLLRLRPGTHILPHCGTTNRRLILHWCLEGCQGIEFRVGDEPAVLNYGGGDGSAIIFDDSFEHTVSHNGTQDRYVVLAVLAHPDLVYGNNYLDQ